MLHYSKATERANLKLLRRLSMLMGAIRTVPHISSFGIDCRTRVAEKEAEKAGASLAEALAALVELKEKRRTTTPDATGDDATPAKQPQHHETMKP